MRCCRKHVVFGKVTKGIEILKKMEQLGTADGKPTQPIKIVDCGEVSKAKSQHAVEKEKGTCDRDRFNINIL